MIQPHEQPAMAAPIVQALVVRNDFVMIYLNTVSQHQIATTELLLDLNITTETIQPKPVKHVQIHVRLVLGRMPISEQIEMIHKMQLYKGLNVSVPITAYRPKNFASHVQLNENLAMGRPILNAIHAKLDFIFYHQRAMQFVLMVRMQQMTNASHVMQTV